MESTAIKLTEASASSTSPSSLLLTSGASGRVNALLSLRALRALFLLLKALLLLLLAPFRGRATNISSSVASPSSASVILAEKSSKEIENKLQDSVSSHRKSPVLRVPAGMVPRRSNHNNSKNNNNNNNLLVSGDSDVAARRALAIRRATQDDDRMSVREVSLFVNSKGETLFTQSWTPVSASSINVRGLVVILHGLNEHSGRYSDFAKKLNANGYKVYGMDWIGHGGSDGLHAYVHSLYDVANDLKAFLKNILKENSGLPCFCFGHSTGAAIILKAMLDPELEGLIEGVVLTSPAVRVQPSHPIFGMLAPIVSLLFPRYQLSAANKNGIVVSRDPEALVAKYSDPLVYTGSIRVRTGSEILRISSYLQQHLSNLKVPFLVLHGSDDAVTDPEASMKLYEEASSIDKSIKLYPNLLHDLLFELERETVTNDIIKWLNSRI